MKRYISPELQTFDLHTESALLGLSGYEAGTGQETNEILTNKKGISDDYNSSLWSHMDNGEASK
ncbi:MAG: hypothetical protein PUC38_08005 [Bacteroidales bacterium]|nr:hypothetical protein [Bacteroidales bacterium]